jgi:hypothetical protein
MNPETLTLTCDNILSIDKESQTVPASAMSATVSVISNFAWNLDTSLLPSGWDVNPKGSTSTSQNTTVLTFTFPANTSTSSATNPITGIVKLNGREISITQEGSIPSVTFNTNSTNFPEGSWWSGTEDVNSVTDATSGVTLNFNDAIRNRDGSYLELYDNSPFVLSIASGTITGVVIHYTSYNRGRSTSSSSNPATTSGSVYATDQGTTGTWTGSSSSISFYLRYYNSSRVRISSIEVYYLPN